eukprot:SAG22_NODE_402_length_11035_cov_6.315929_1_plen_173_part_00
MWWAASAESDNYGILSRSGYDQIVPVSSRFIGWFADLTAVVKAGTDQKLHLTLPNISADYTFSQSYVHTGGDLDVGNFTTLAAATKHCDSLEDCMGFTVDDGHCTPSPWHSGPGPAEMLPVFFKARTMGGTNSGQMNAGAYCVHVKPARFDGIFFENVEALSTAEWLGRSTC